MLYLFLFPPINTLLLNLNDGLREHLFANVGVLGKVNPFSPLSFDCLSPIYVEPLPSVYSLIGGDGATDVIPLFGVTFPGNGLVKGSDGGGIIDVDWWLLILDKIPRELFGLSLGANKFAVDAATLINAFTGPELKFDGLLGAAISFALDASLKFCRSPDGVEPATEDDWWGWWYWIRGAIGEIIDDMARFNLLPVGVLLKLNARFTCKDINYIFLWRYIYWYEDGVYVLTYDLISL